jgi:hypothetical protein
MLGGWYCRSLVQNKDGEESQEERANNYKPQYRALKRKLKFLIYVSGTGFYCHGFLLIITKIPSPSIKTN